MTDGALLLGRVAVLGPVKAFADAK
ncbi:MAG: hypothetical protein QOG87_151, partial [Actinomycetota bacterium]